MPEIVAQDGAIDGYASYIALMPERDLAVTVLASSQPDVAPRIAQNILYAIFYTCRSGTNCAR